MDHVFIINMRRIKLQCMLQAVVAAGKCLSENFAGITPSLCRGTKDSPNQANHGLTKASAPKEPLHGCMQACFIAIFSKSSTDFIDISTLPILFPIHKSQLCFLHSLLSCKLIRIVPLMKCTLIQNFRFSRSCLVPRIIANEECGLRISN